MTNHVTYSCPHCRKPFSVVPTAQSQVVSCPSCRGRVTIGPQQPVAPPPQRTAVPPPPPQQQMARAPPPPQQPIQPQYQQPYQQQPYMPQPYQQQYQQPAAPTPPPKKSKKGVVIGVVVVVAILIVAALAYLFIFAGEEGPKEYSATYEEFLNDIKIDPSTFSVTFKTYDDGDIVDITGTVEKIKLADVPPGTAGVDSGTWTIIYFESPSPTSVAVFDCFAYEGDMSDEYPVGEKGTVRVHIKKMSAMGITMEYPEECMTAETLEDYISAPTAALDFTESPPSSGNFTGGIVSASDVIYLSDIKIEIYDSSTSWTGEDDGDLTDNDPEEIDVWFGNLYCEFTDVNDNDKLDAADIIQLFNAESGDRIEIQDLSSEDTIASYTIS